MSGTDEGLFDDLPEPGVFSGVCTLLGGLAGLALVALLYFYGPPDGPVAGAHLALVVPLGLVFAFLLAAFTFLIGWILESVWPLFLMLIIVGLLLMAPLLYFFGADVLLANFSTAVMFAQ